MSTRACVRCGERKLQKDFGSKQFKWTNYSPTCLDCAAAVRAEQYWEWHAQAQNRTWTCVVCAEEKKKEYFGKKQVKSSAPTCLDCAGEARYIDYAIHETDKQYVLSRCHDEQTVELLMKHGKVDKWDMLAFLDRQEDAAFCIHCEDEGDFLGGYDLQDRWWTGADWFLWHLESSHTRSEQESALIAQIVLKARACCRPPLRFECSPPPNLSGHH